MPSDSSNSAIKYLDEILALALIFNFGIIPPIAYDGFCLIFSKIKLNNPDVVVLPWVPAKPIKQGNFLEINFKQAERWKISNPKLRAFFNSGLSSLIADETTTFGFP